MIQQTPDTQTIDGITYQLDNGIPYTGKHTMYYDNGQKCYEPVYKGSLYYAGFNENGIKQYKYQYIGFDDNDFMCEEWLFY